MEIKTVNCIRKLWNTNGTHVAAPALYLVIAGNSRRWVFRYGPATQRQTLKLGWPLEPSVRGEVAGYLTLAQARAQAAKLREAHRIKGKDPKAVLASEKKDVTFAADFETYYDNQKGLWGYRHAKIWRRSIETHVLPTIGDRVTSELTQDHIADVLKPIWRTIHPTALLIHARIEEIIASAMALRRDEFGSQPNPAADLQKYHLPRIKAPEAVNHLSVPWREMPALYARLSEDEDHTPSLALRFLLLCGCPRSGEITGARWSEIDGDVWNVPASRMKSGRARQIPLTDEARLLLSLLRRRTNTAYIFPGLKGGYMTHGQMQRLLRRLQVPGKVHGMRATFRTWATETISDLSFVQDRAIEACLDHKVVGEGEVRARYERTGLIKERREIQMQWAAFLTGAKE